MGKDLELSSKHIWEAVSENPPGFLRHSYFYDSKQLGCDHVLSEKFANKLQAQFQAAVDGKNIPYRISKNILYVVDSNGRQADGIFYIFSIELRGSLVKKAGIRLPGDKTTYIMKLLFKRVRDEPRLYKLLGICSDDIQKSKEMTPAFLKLLASKPTKPLGVIVYKLKEKYPTETMLKPKSETPETPKVLKNIKYEWTVKLNVFFENETLKSNWQFFDANQLNLDLKLAKTPSNIIPSTLISKIQKIAKKYQNNLDISYEVYEAIESVKTHRGIQPREKPYVLNIGLNPVLASKFKAMLDKGDEVYNVRLLLEKVGTNYKIIGLDADDIPNTIDDLKTILDMITSEEHVREIEYVTLFTPVKTKKKSITTPTKSQPFPQRSS